MKTLSWSDFHYWEFRQQHWDLAEVVVTLSDPAEREEALRTFWHQDAEKRFPNTGQQFPAWVWRNWRWKKSNGSTG